MTQTQTLCRRSIIVSATRPYHGVDRLHRYYDRVSFDDLSAMLRDLRGNGWTCVPMADCRSNVENLLDAGYRQLCQRVEDAPACPCTGADH